MDCEVAIANLKQRSASGWWVGRLVEFDSGIIPRSRHDDQEQAVTAMRRDQQVLSDLLGEQVKLIVFHVLECA